MRPLRYSINLTLDGWRLEAREPAGVRLGGGGDAACAEKVAIGTGPHVKRHGNDTENDMMRERAAAIWPRCRCGTT
jgi:hypothetical protein